MNENRADTPHDLRESKTKGKGEQQRAEEKKKARTRQEKRQGFPLGEADLSEEKERHEWCHLTRWPDREKWQSVLGRQRTGS